MAGVQPAQLVDGNGVPIRGQAWDAVNHQFAMPQVAAATADSQSGVPFSPSFVELMAGGAAPNPADSVATANLLMLVQAFQTGTGIFSPRRLATNIINIKAQAITAGTGFSIFTPTAGKKFRILGYHLSLSVAGSVLFEDGAGSTANEILRTPLLAAATGQASGDMGIGVVSSTATNQLYIDTTASGNVSGWVAIEQE
jgi:hypothetical protein